MAHKKGQGSTRNGRDSNPQFRGIKLYGGQVAKPGAIIVRQCGTKFKAGYLASRPPPTVESRARCRSDRHRNTLTHNALTHRETLSRQTSFNSDTPTTKSATRWRSYAHRNLSSGIGWNDRAVYAAQMFGRYGVRGFWNRTD